MITAKKLHSETISNRLDQPQYLDIRALSGKELAEIRVSSESHYSDSLWNFRKEVGEHSVRDISLRFSSIELLDGSFLTSKENAQYLSIFKEFAYSLISNPPETRPKLTTILKYLGHGPVWFLRFMHKQRIPYLDEVSHVDMQRFLTWCAGLSNLNKSEAIISNATLETRVAGLWWLYAQRGKMNRGLQVDPWENQTSKSWAAQAATKRVHGRTMEMPDEVAQALVTHAMSVIKKTPLYSQAAHAYGSRTKSKIYQSFDWSLYGFANHFEWNSFPSEVTIASYVLIALFSGMRVDEIVGLQLDYGDKRASKRLSCTYSEEVEVDGLRRICYFVRGYTKKLEKEPKLTTWQVTPVVHEAIEAVINIRSSYRRDGNNYLFAAKSKTSATSRMFENSINDGLRKFVRRYDIRWNGVHWHLSTHQFRKKFARMMVRQGLGLRDIQDQLKHIDIEMTKRYGHMDLYHELQMERFALSNEQYDELLRSSKPIIGGGAQLINAMRTEFIGKTRENQQVFIETLSKSALIDAVDFGLCLYNAGRAQCNGNRQNCKPVDCLNSVIPLDTALRHLESRRHRNEHLLQVVKSPLSRAHILAQQSTTLRLLEQAKKDDVVTTEKLKEIALRDR